MPKLCKVNECTQPVWGKGYCSRHQSLREDKKTAGKDSKELDLPTLLELAQKVFNTYIRLRDAKKGCISCGGRVDHAGHFFAQGSFSYIRFDEVNTNGQCEVCNCGKHGNLDNYATGLEQRYTKDQIKSLYEKSQGMRLYKWSREELTEIISTYKAKTIHLQAERTDAGNQSINQIP